MNRSRRFFSYQFVHRHHCARLDQTGRVPRFFASIGIETGRGNSCRRLRIGNSSIDRKDLSTIGRSGQSTPFVCFSDRTSFFLAVRSLSARPIEEQLFASELPFAPLLRQAERFSIDVGHRRFAHVDALVTLQLQVNLTTKVSCLMVGWFVGAMRRTPWPMECPCRCYVRRKTLCRSASYVVESNIGSPFDLSSGSIDRLDLEQFAKSR